MAEKQNEAADEGLSSEEENLIAQSTYEIRNIIGIKARPTFMSRFVDGNGEENSMLSESNEETSSQEGFSRRLRVFQDITQRVAGKSSDDTHSKAQGFLDTN